MTFLIFLFSTQRVIREEIDGGVSWGGFVEDAYVEVGWFSGYREVKEVDGFADSFVGLSWMLLWMVLMYCVISSWVQAIPGLFKLHGRYSLQLS